MNSSSNNIHLFSYRYIRALRTSDSRTDFPNQMDNLKKTIEYFDLSLTGSKGFYNLIYGALILKDSKSYCAFTKLPQKIELKMIYENFYSPLIITLITIFITINILLRILIFCLQPIFVDEKFKKSPAKFKDQNNLKDFFYAFFKMSDREAIPFIGTEAYYFLQFSKVVILCMFLFSIVGLGLMFLDIFSPGNALHTQDITRTSIAALNPGGWNLQSLPIIGHFFGIIFYLMIAFGCNILLYYISKSIIKKEDIIPKQTITFYNVPKDIIDKEIFMKYFSEQSEDVLAVNIAWEVRSISKEYAKLKKLQDILEIRDFKSNRFEFWKWEEQALLDKIFELEDMLSNHEKKGSGFIFVTFATVESTNTFKEKFLSSNFKGHSDDLKTKEWKIKKSPKSPNIIWENLSYGTWAQVIRRVIGYFFLMIGYFLASLFLLFLFASSLLRDYTKRSFVANFNLLSTNFQSFLVGFNIFLDLTPLWILLMIFIIVPTTFIFVSVSKYHTKTEEKRAIAVLFLMFIFINTTILPRLMNTIVGLSVAFRAKPPFNTYDYFFISLIPDLIGTVTLIPLLFKTIESIFIFIFILFSLCKCRIVRPKYTPSFNYSNSIAIFLSILYFGTMIPILPWFGFLFFIYNYFNDRYMILYYYQKSEEIDESFFKNLIRSFLFYILISPFFVMIILSRFQGVSFVIFLILFFVVNPILWAVFLFITRKKQKIHQVFIMNEEKMKIYYQSPYEEYFEKIN